MIRAATAFVDRAMGKYTLSPKVLITITMLFMGITMTTSTPKQMVLYWPLDPVHFANGYDPHRGLRRSTSPSCESTPLNHRKIRENAGTGARIDSS